MSPTLRTRAVRLVALGLTVGLGAVGIGCGDGGGGGGDRGQGEKGKGGGARGPRAFPVEVEKVHSEPVEFTVTAVGSVEAFERIQVTARVAGVAEAVRFKEGDTVKAGDVLVEIDPSRYRLALRAARAAMQKAEAAQVEAEAGLQRREQVNQSNPGLIRGEELDTWRSRAGTAAAELSAARIAVEQAALNLQDAYVKAPSAGVLQTRSVVTGQFVQLGTVLGTLVRRDPLLVRFHVPESDAARLVPGMEAQFRVKEDARLHVARITHVAAAADPTTRMVTLTGEVESEGRESLRPGAFAEVSVPVARIEAPVIPQTAVRPSERGFLAFVVEQEKARERVLSLGMRTADGRVEVRSGIQAGDLLVVRGAEALREGASVRIEQGGGEGDAGGASRGGGKGGRP